MINRILRRCTRKPLTCLAVILFVAVLTVILCFLNRSQEEEMQHLKDTYESTPVEFAVTWLDGTRLNDSAPASGHMADILPGLFLGNGRYKSAFSNLVTDLQIRMSIWCRPNDQKEPAEDGILYDPILIDKLVGITSSDAAFDQPTEFGDLIEWFDGYDESILLTDDFVCIVPCDYNGPMDEIKLTMSLGKEFSCTFKVVGQYAKKNNDNEYNPYVQYRYDVYCPYLTMEYIYLRVNWPNEVQRLTGKLANNDDLEKFREAAAEWFAAPNPEGEPTPWENPFGYESYPLAMDIDDSQLDGLRREMEKSMTINRIASTLVFILSTGAGFLTGFLVIRSRKREIALMRTLGNSNGSVCLEFGLEQLLCVVLGVILGGSYALWKPIGQLSLFAGVYMAGLCLALLIFVRSNLLSTMKEDE